MDIDSKYQLRSFICEITDSNYYNEKHQIIRIKIGDKLYDCKYLGLPIYPHPNDYVALVITCDEFIKKTKSIVKDRLSFLPGIINRNNDLDDIYFGIVYPISKRQTVAGANPTCGGASLAIESTNMFDPDKIALALTTPLNVDYTNKDKTTDFKDFSNGVFINKDGTILIKSGPSSITMGEEGIYLGGNIHWESADHAKEWMRDNTLSKFIPLTLVTIPIAMPEVPLIEKFQRIANVANKVVSICTKAVRVTALFT